MNSLNTMYSHTHVAKIQAISNLVPSPPTTLAYISSSATTSSVNISFTAPTPPPAIASYSPSTGSGSGTESVYTISGLTSNTPYSITLTATSVNGKISSASSAVSVLTIPSAPTIGTVTLTGTTASVPFTAPSGTGTITGYTVTSSPGSLTGTGASSPLSVSGLTGGTAYTFTVKATNASGTSAPSGSSNSLTPSSIIYSGQLLKLPTTGTTGASSLILNSASKTITGITGTQSFMNGTYNSSGSGNLGGWDPFKLFDGTTGSGFHSPDTPYDATSGNYNGAKSVTISGTITYGEWMIINFPYSFKLTSYTLSARSGYDMRAPRDWTIGGSNDGVTWTLLDTQNGITTGSNTFTVSSTTNYSYNVLVVRGCKPATDYMNLGEWVIYDDYTA